MRCPCGHEFPKSLGIYGCPNCGGDAQIDAEAREDSQARQARSRSARIAAGGKQIAVMLTPAAAATLASLTARGETIAAVVNRLLTAAVTLR